MKFHDTEIVYKFNTTCHEGDYISIWPTEFEVFQRNGLATLREEIQAIVEVRHVRRLDYTCIFADKYAYIKNRDDIV